MKGKLRLMWRGVIALVLVSTLGLVMAVPAAANVSSATVAVAPTLIDTVAEYTISFDITENVAIGQKVEIEFPATTTVPTSYATGDITIQGESVLAGNAVGDAGTRIVTITLVTAIAAPATVEVIFTTAAGIKNPTTPGTTYTLNVWTDTEPAHVTSEEYTISCLPTVTVLKPNQGNVGDTMWVEVVGTDFAGTDTTNVSTTSLNFGTGITVVSTKYIDVDEIDVQITINATGTPNVVATTPAGTGTEGKIFTANAAGIAQVDVWNAYTLTADPFVPGTLVFQDQYDTITLAETASGTGDTLIVHAATYVENVAIDQEITLESLSGADSTIIDSDANTIVNVTADNVTIDGFTIKGDPTATRCDGITITGNTFTVQNNKFIDLNGSIISVASGSTVIDDGLIHNNNITGLGADADWMGIWLEGSTNALSGVSITDNIISTIDSDAHYPAIQVDELTGEVDDITISGNILSDCFAGIRVQNAAGSTTPLTITNNTISGMTTAGVTVATGDPVFSLENNVITDNLYGIELMDSAATYTIKYNDLSGNTWGLYHWGGAGTITAQYNWWGDISGPSSGSGLTAETYWPGQVSTALGSGDPMSKDVDTWDPWLTETQAKTVTDGIAYHGSTMVLEPGWNTLSVPLKLKDSANTIAEIMDLGDFLTNENVQVVYQYNPALPGWVNIGINPIEIVPSRGYYIKILGTDTVDFPVLYSGTLGLSALELPVGWNLIGSAFGIDKDAGSSDISVGDYGVCSLDPTGTDTYGAVEDDSTDADVESWKKVADALASLGLNASVVISPSVPGQEATWGTVASDQTTFMVFGEAYWVFMTDSATLAGYEVTPIYWIAS